MKRKDKARRKAPQRARAGAGRQPAALWLHALAAIGDERWEEAIGALQRFLEVDEATQNRPIVYMNLSACYLGLERYDEALAMLAEAARTMSDSADILYNRGILCACAGRVQEAIAAFETFGRRWPREARKLEIRNALKKLRHIVQGKLPPGDYLVDHLEEQLAHDVELGDFHVVERKGRRMIAANPARPEGHFAVGVGCLQQGRYPEALEALLAAHDRDPNYVPTLYDIGHTYLKMDEPAQAIPWLERAYAGDPQHLAALHQLGVACEQLGRRDEAVTWWQRALKVNPEYYLAHQRLHELGLEPAPSEPPLPPKYAQMAQMTPIVKARMNHPHVYRNGGVTLTHDQLSFVLEDTENPRNATVYSGQPFYTVLVAAKDRGNVLDMMGTVKMLLRLINRENTRQVAVLAYYQDRPIFAYQAQFEKGEMVAFDAAGQFVVTEVPRFFKLSIDSDLSMPYGAPMQGILIYVNQAQQPDILLSTLTPHGR